MQWITATMPLFVKPSALLSPYGHVPIHLKDHYYQGFVQAYGVDPRISRFCQVYFYPTWFGGTFSPANGPGWLNSQTRTTNNSVESFHCAIKKFFARFPTCLSTSVPRSSSNTANLLPTRLRPRGARGCRQSATTCELSLQQSCEVV